MKNIFWYVQSLIGVGHLVRSLNIANKLKDCNITMVTGGEPFTIPNMKHIRQVVLPGIRMNTDMELESIDPSKDLSVIKEKRKVIIRNNFATCNFDLIITEQFPFGGHSLKEELFDLFRLNQKKSKMSKVISSVRDILSPDMTGEERDQKTLMYINKYYDKILVHSDPNILPLSTTFQSYAKIKHPIEYTGYVTQDYDSVVPFEEKNKLPIVVFGMGGSNRGFEFLDRVLEASENLYSKVKHKLVVFLGKHGEDQKIHYQTKTSHLSHVFIFPFNSAFLNYLASASLYIGLAGYNTTMDLLHFGIPSIICPYTERHEPDLRLRTLNIDNQFCILDRNNFTIDELMSTMEQKLISKKRYKSPVELSGASVSAQKICSIMTK